MACGGDVVEIVGLRWRSSVEMIRCAAVGREVKMERSNPPSLVELQKWEWWQRGNSGSGGMVLQEMEAAGYGGPSCDSG